MKKKTTKLLALLVGIVLVISLGVIAAATDSKTDEVKIVNSEEIPLKLWYDEEAGIMEGENSPTALNNGDGEDISWARWSLPLGNGYFGANVFGRTETERIQITEKTLQNPPTLTKDGVKYSVGGLNSFSETYIDFNHTNSAVTDYRRELDLETAISSVEYKYNGVKYTREYFTSYDDKALVIRLDADKDGELNFDLRPTIPYLQSYGGYQGDGVTKTGSVTSSVENGVGHIELAGKMGYFDIDFLGLYRVYTDGGEITASTVEHKYEDTDKTQKTVNNGIISVKNAKSAYIVVTLGSDYELSSEIFTSADSSKPTKNTTLDDTRAKVGGYMSAVEAKISGKSYEDAYKALRDTHVKDHSGLFGRVALNLDCKKADYEDLTTDKLLEKYQKGTNSTYLETLVFQYGRYLLVASSRDGALPANLQGAWNTYDVPPWACGYWHNINVQMNYWPAFSTNLAETFEAYADYNAAYMEQTEKYADDMISKYNPSAYDKDGGNGWVIGFDGYQFRVTSSRSAGDLGFTTQLFWEYYEYTKDPAILESVYKVLVNAARYITKCVELDEDGNYLVSYCDSPEMHVNGVWYYTEGTTYAQSFAYQNNYNALCAAKELGIDLEDTGLLSQEEYSILNTIMEQIDKYDPIHVGLSGQIKEFREETYYGSIGDEYDHRHISQLVGLYPGNIINSTTPAWLDATKVVLSERGDGGMGWSKAHKMNLWARAKNGERAHQLLSVLLKTSTAYNLWNVGKPYQIDGSFGATAGVSEMLLQSHDGYIHPLAAIPDTWGAGSYTGLVARGNFEVSAAWEDGVATQFDIRSNAGGTASVYYPTITNASVVTADGTKVSYKVEGTNLISFDTEKGETYIITGLEAQDDQEAPSGFGYVKNNNSAYELSWDAPTGAASYNVYVAIENASTYTLVGNTTNTNFTYTPDEANKDARITFAVTAVSISGVESERTLCYTSDALETEYGTIPGNEVGYPFALFVKGSEADSEYVFVDSYTSFIKAMNQVKTMFHPTSGEYKGGTAAIYMTRDCKLRGDSFNDGSLIDGTVIFDLGNHNATMGVNRLIGFNANAVNGSVAHTMRMEVKNGTILTLKKPVAELFSDSGNNYTGTKKFELLFENVTFSKADVETSGYTLVNSRGTFSSTKQAELKVDFKNCTFEYAYQTSDLTLIDCSQGGEYAKCDVTIAGGTIKASNLDTVTVFKGSKNDTISYVADEDGNEPVFEVTGDTEYGSIPAADMTKDKYFAMFAKKANDTSYTYQGTFGSLFKGALNNGRDKVKRNSGAYAGGTVVIYMIRDYVYDPLTDDNGGWNRAMQIDGTMILDLAGRELTANRPRLLGFETNSADIIGSASDYNTAVKFTNGTIRTNNPIVEVLAGGSTFTGTKNVDVSFDNITFAPASGNATRTLVKSRNTFKSGQTVDLDVDFTDCTFNYEDSGVVIYDDTAAGDNSNPVVADVNVYGGNINLSDISKLTVRKDTSHDAVTFAKKADGTRTNFVLNYAEKAPTTAFATDEGTMYLASEGLSKELIVEQAPITYTLSNVKAGDNGHIPLDKSGSAFSVFYNTVHVASYDNLNGEKTGALNGVKNLLYGGDGALKGKTLTVYMHKDYDDDITSSRFPNYAQIDGTVVLDLGGHTITQTNGTYLFNLTAKAVEGKLPTTAVKVKNGKILTTSHEPMIVQSVGTSGNFGFQGTKTFNFTYENVTFDKHSSYASYYAPLAKVDTFDDNGGKKNVALNIVFDNCTFNSKDSILFNCATSNYVDVNATINGGSIKAQSMGNDGVMKASDTGDKVTFGMYNGAYTTLSLPSDASAPTVKFNNNMMELKLVSESTSEKVYQFTPVELSDELKSYAPKMSLTLDSSLKMNIYVPEKLTQSFTIDGVANDYDLKTTFDDGTVYYRKTIDLASSDAIKEVVLKVKVSVGGQEFNGIFTFSLLKYVNNSFKNGNDVEKQLMRDVLSYVRASYKYFKPDDTDAVAKIDALIGAKYDQLEAFTAETVTVNPTSFKAATFYLGDTPAFRFYLNDGDDASKYTFKIDGKNVKAVEGSDSNGKYLQISVYAYAMDDVISYYVDGKEVGSYHLANYYNWIKTQSNTTVVSLVERFWTYCQSARDYKDRVDVQIKYVDEAGKELATTYKGTYKKGEEFSVLSPSVSGYYTREVYKIASANSDTTYKVVYKKLPSNIDATTAKSKLPDIVAWGDSITIGIGQDNVDAANTYGIDLQALGSVATGTNYPTVLQNLIRSRVYSGMADIANCGVGGEATSTIAARADTRTYYLYLDGAVTIGNSEVVVPLTHYASTGRVGILRQGGKPTVNPVTITGKDASGNVISVTGTLNRTLTDDAPANTNANTCDAKYLKYTFTRTDGGTNTLNFVSGARVTSKASYLYDGRSCIVFMGENGGYSDINELIKQQEEILEACGNPKEYLIVSTTSGSNSSRAAMEKALTERWGDRYLSMGHELNSSRKAYELVGYSEADIVSVMSQIVEGKVTSLMIKDNCHPNAVGYAAIGNIMFERLYRLGSFDEIFDYYDRLQNVKTESFTFNGYTATVIRPANPNGKWVWKTEFFDAFDQAEEALLDQGYTRVYYKISNKYGNPESVSLMKNFHQEVIKRYNLNDKCILFGFSRGGLYAFNFAHAHPTCVDKVYLDNPVLDLKTWPTKSKNPSEYAGMLSSYGLTDETFATFKGSPVDKFAEFFAHDIPVLIVAGDADQTVPFDKNAGKLIEYATTNGHDVKYIVEKGKDHHPHSLTDVTPILDFCNKPSMVSNPLTKADFAGKTITFLGDSITYGVGVSNTSKRYSSLVASSLGMNEINLGISGSIMCMEGASTRESRADDIPSISLDSDYVGILLGVNDFDACRYDAEKKYSYLGEFGSKDPTTVYGALDKMCSDLVKRFGATDTKVFFMTPVVTSWNNSITNVRDWDQSKKNACGYTLRELCDAIEKVATHYGIITLDLNTVCKMESSDFSDGIHPNDSGAQKIANRVESFLLTNYSFDK